MRSLTDGKPLLPHVRGYYCVESDEGDKQGKEDKGVHCDVILAFECFGGYNTEMQFFGQNVAVHSHHMHWPYVVVGEEHWCGST
jgi:hypothetical protein